MKQILKVSLAISMVAILVVSTQAMAVSKSDLNDVQNKITETEKEIKDVKNKKSDVMSDIQKLTADITEYERKITDLEEESAKLEKSIKEKEKEIKQKQEDYDANYEKFVNRIVASYEAGTTTYLDIILSSKDFTDAISNWYYLSEIADADKALLELLERQKNELKEAKNVLETDKKKVEDNKANIVKTNNALKKSKRVKDEYVNQLNEEQKDLQKELDQFEKDKKMIEAELRKIAQQNNYGDAVAPSAAGYIFPIKGLSKANINVPHYPSYPGHTGTDININVIGKTIVAVKSGTVITSTALKYNNGNYRSYGEYVVIDHHDGTMTLYAHGLAGSRKVVKGQKVSQGQAIMTVGSTGKSTGPHLHFEVRVGGRAVNPLPYLP